MKLSFWVPVALVYSIIGITCVSGGKGQESEGVSKGTIHMQGKTKGGGYGGHEHGR